MCRQPHLVVESRWRKAKSGQTRGGRARLRRAPRTSGAVPLRRSPHHSGRPLLASGWGACFPPRGLRLGTLCGQMDSRKRLRAQLRRRALPLSAHTHWQPLRQSSETVGERATALLRGMPSGSRKVRPMQEVGCSLLLAWSPSWACWVYLPTYNVARDEIEQEAPVSFDYFRAISKYVDFLHSRELLL